jgi:hypothetical protein
MLFRPWNVLYFYISSFRSMSAAPNVGTFRSSLISRLLGKLLIIIIIIITVKCII